jgi:hypothetical protein
VSPKQMRKMSCTAQIKVCQQIGRKDSIQAACRRISRLEAILYLGAQNFKILSKIIYQKNQNLKHLAVNVLFWAYSIVTLSDRSNLAGRYL